MNGIRCFKMKNMQCPNCNSDMVLAKIGDEDRDIFVWVCPNCMEIIRE